MCTQPVTVDNPACARLPQTTSKFINPAVDPFHSPQEMVYSQYQALCVA